jgi:hypothetical protein
MLRVFDGFQHFFSRDTRISRRVREISNAVPHRMGLSAKMHQNPGFAERGSRFSGIATRFSFHVPLFSFVVRQFSTSSPFFQTVYGNI